MATLRELRLQSGLTQVQLAQAMGVSESTIQKLERNEVLPSYSTLQRLYEVFGAVGLQLEFHADNRRNRNKKPDK